MLYCPHCMKPVTGGGSCPNCGGDLSWTGQKGIDLPVGTVLNGGNGLRTYQIGAARGKGGFGITYIALETNSGRRMAVKEYYPTRWAFRGGNGVDVQAMTGQEEPFRSGMNSFLDEGRMLLSQDDLPCVVRVIDYFQANGTAYLVMEYLDGVALHAQMSRMGGRIPVSELMPRLAPLIRDIGQLHRRGVIHRDISPDNIMWMPDGTLKLLDFGSARSMESNHSMTVLMKQGFSPIEQYRSTGQGPYSDIYALAATIYYCVTGVIPPSSVERLGKDTLQSPIALGAALTVQQETALLWALSLQPDARPQSMEEFSAMLYQAAPPPPPPPPPPPRPAKFNPLFIGVAAAVVLLVAGFFALNNGRTIDTPFPANSPEQSTAPGHSTAPGYIGVPGYFDEPGYSDTPTLGISTGVTDNGFLYQIIDRNHAVLTGFVTNADFSYMPDDIDGVPVTEIADGAFAGAGTGGFVNLPLYLETIGANAFLGCTELTYVSAYSDVTTASNSFSGCDNIWCVTVRDTAASGWRLPGGVRLYYYGMETGVGSLNAMTRSGGLLTGETDSGFTVLLDVRPGTETVTGLDNVDWICSWALDNLSYSATVELGEFTLYPYEAFSSSAFTWSAPDGALSDQWLLSCAAASSVNASRPSGAARMEPDLELMQAAMIRAEEYAELRDLSNRPDGKGNSFTVLAELDISRGYAAVAAGVKSEYADAWERAKEYITQKYADALTESDSSTYAGQYYTRMGVAVSQEHDGQYAWTGYVIIP